MLELVLINAIGITIGSFHLTMNSKELIVNKFLLFSNVTFVTLGLTIDI